jgi:biopolymer transport protein ExbD
MEAITLNITPVMNLFVVLIPFLLSAAVFMQISVLDTNLPQLAEAKVLNEKQKDEDKLIVSLNILRDGFQVGRIGSESQASRQKYWGKNGPFSTFIPKKNGEYNFGALNSILQKIKKIYPDALSIVILPEGNVNYETIVRSMDATRETLDFSMDFTGVEGKEKTLLFPDAIIGHTAEPEEGKK